MRRREFMRRSAAALGAGLAGACASRGGARSGAAAGAPADRVPPRPLDVAAFRAERRMASLRFGEISYVERGAGDAALFLHGVPLNGYQWRGAIERLSAHRRCVAPDFMGLGYSEVSAQQPVHANAQVEMLVALLDSLSISSVDVIAGDSGGAVAQLLMVRHPARVRTVLLTNCDVEPDSPPPKVLPIIEMARAGTLADMIARWLADKDLARAEFGAMVFQRPDQFADETIDYYFSPIVRSALSRERFHAYNIALQPNPLAGIEAALARSTVPTRIVWGSSDDIFSQADPDYLDRTLGQSRGVRRLPGAKLFFQEEYPEVIAEEARRLWGVAG